MESPLNDQQYIQKLEKENRILQKKLSRSEINRAHLEQNHENQQKLLYRIISNLETSLDELQQSQLQLIQSEKMSALGNLMAGVAHEINNPLGFVDGNVSELKKNLQNLIEYIQYLEHTMPSLGNDVIEARGNLDIEFLLNDLPNMLNSMEVGCDRIRNISNSLRLFARTDTNSKIQANIHDNLDSTLLILKYRLKADNSRPEIDVICDYGELPEIACFPGQLSQVFMNILANSIDMFDETAVDKSYEYLQGNPQQITIRTRLISPEKGEPKSVEISIRDNGKGIPEDMRLKIFDRQFTTKDIGKGTGLGLAIVQQIVVEGHNGSLKMTSEVGQGTEFFIRIPM
ncbi:MAG: ATP-binding protein [Cyanobacteria bacterium P01_E01_bin.6]